MKARASRDSQAVGDPLCAEGRELTSPGSGIPQAIEAAPRVRILAIPVLALWVLAIAPSRFVGSDGLEAALAAWVLARAPGFVARGFSPFLAGRFLPQDSLALAGALAGFLLGLLLSVVHATGEVSAQFLDPRGGPLSFHAAIATLVALREARGPIASNAGAGTPLRALARASTLGLLASVGAIALVALAGGGALVAFAGVLALLAGGALDAASILGASRRELLDRHFPDSPTASPRDAPGALVEAGRPPPESAMAIAPTGSADIEAAARVEWVMVPRRGIITVGQPRILDVYPLKEGVAGEDLLHLAAVAEYSVQHPLRDAVLRGYRSHLRTIAKVRGVDYLEGRGIRAEHQGKPLLFGGLRLLAEEGLPKDLIARLEARLPEWVPQGETALFVALGGEVLGVVTALDPIRPDAIEAARLLSLGGIRLVIESGDAPQSVRTLLAGVEGVEVLAPLSGSEVDRAFEERRAAHPRAGRVRSPAQAELPGREGPPATFAWWTCGRLGDPTAKTDRAAGELEFPRTRPSRMARFLLDSRRTHRFEILGACVLGGYHLFALPLLCGALALWTPWAPLPAIAATLGTGLPWLLHEFRPLLEGGEGLASERQRSPSSTRRT